jgi:hypothetical protein
MAKQSNLPQVILPTFDVALNDTAQKHLDDARLMVIKSDADYEFVAQSLKDSTARERMVTDGEKRHVGPLQTAIEEIRAVWRPAKQAYTTAITIKKKLLADWLGHKAAEQRRLQQEADARAAAERRRLEAAAARAENKGNTDKAIDLAQQAAMTVAPIVRSEPPKIAGQSVREYWLFEIEDASLIPREYLMPDTARIRKFVNAMKGEMPIPGVRIYSEKRIASGV